MDSDYGHPDPGVGDPTGSGLVDLKEISCLCVGQGPLERDWSFRQRENTPLSP